jgi:hypothetical protein
MKSNISPNLVKMIKYKGMRKAGYMCKWEERNLMEDNGVDMSIILKWL